MPSSTVHRDLHSFPTRRSSDLDHDRIPGPHRIQELRLKLLRGLGISALAARRQSPVKGSHQLAAGKDYIYPGPVDRKSTRLNSSHMSISYAVFCLKKKNC